jgi:hypothetical protein
MTSSGLELLSSCSIVAQLTMLPHITTQNVQKQALIYPTHLRNSRCRYTGSVYFVEVEIVSYSFSGACSRQICIMSLPVATKQSNELKLIPRIDTCPRHFAPLQRRRPAQLVDYF